MAIEYVYGDIFERPVQALVNPVNTKGVMGAGLALQFKRRYPAMFRDYQAMCANGWLRAGEIWMYLVPGSLMPRYILNAASKDDWQQPSSREMIEGCVLNLYNLIVKYNMTSIAIPALGCGEGGMNWLVVQDIIYEGLKCFGSNVQILVYPPHVRETQASRSPVKNAASTHQLQHH